MKTEIIAILDRSGSMMGLERDTIGGFNSFVEEQKKVEGECNVTLVLFDNDYDVLYEARALNEVPELTGKEYFARGSTSLYDAIGKSSQTAGARFAAMTEADRPEKVIVLIITDGYENTSREFTREQIKNMIQHQEEKYAWEFVYLGANQDAFAVGQQFGMKMSNVATYAASEVGTRGAYAAFADKTTSLRSGFDANAVAMAASVAENTQKEENAVSNA